MKKTLAALTIYLASHTAVFAAPATPEEAKRLTDLFQSYIGTEAGILTVAPTGESYDVTLDVLALIKKAEKMPDSKIEFKMAPLVIHLTPQSDGKWVLKQDMPMEWSVIEPGKTNMQVKAETLKLDAVFDEKLMVFTSYTSDIVNLKGTISDDKPATADSPKLDFAIANIHGAGDAKSSGAGIFDGEYNVRMNGFSASADSLPPGDGSVPITGKATLDKLAYTVSLKGVRGQAFVDLIKWGMALPESAKVKDAKLTDAQQAEMKALALAAMPFFDNISINETLDKFMVTSPLGNAGLDKIGVAVDFSGATKDGFVREAITLEGLTTPQGILPSWSDPLMPSKFVFDFRLSDLDFASVTKLILDEPALLDTTVEGDVKAANDAKLLKAIIPSGAAKFTLQAGKLTGKTYDIDYEGTVTGGPEVPPTGKGTIKSIDLIPLITALQALPPELGMAQASPAIIAFNSMAKKQPDGTLLWDLDGMTVGKFLINGVDFMSLMSLGGMGATTPDVQVTPDQSDTGTDMQEDGALTDDGALPDDGAASEDGATPDEALPSDGKSTDGEESQDPAKVE